MGEFVSDGDLVTHNVIKGTHKGTSHQKQVWKHKHSNHTFTWHHKLTKAEFDKSALWKIADSINKRSLPGCVRLRFIVDLQNKKIGKGPTADGELKYTRNDDMINRVMAVLGAVGSKQPLSIFDNKHMRAYIQRLNPRHQPPYRLERVRIVEVLIDYVALEISRIVKERRSVLGEAFASGSIDFWTDKHRRETYGAFVMDFLAPRYEISVGNGISMNLFMSNETKNRLDPTTFISGVSRFLPILRQCSILSDFRRRRHAPIFRLGCSQRPMLSKF